MSIVIDAEKMMNVMDTLARSADQWRSAFIAKERDAQSFMDSVRVLQEQLKLQEARTAEAVNLSHQYRNERDAARKELVEIKSGVKL